MAICMGIKISSPAQLFMKGKRDLTLCPARMQQPVVIVLKVVSIQMRSTMPRVFGARREKKEPKGYFSNNPKQDYADTCIERFLEDGFQEENNGVGAFMALELG